MQSAAMSLHALAHWRCSVLQCVHTAKIPSMNWVWWCLDGWGAVRPRFKKGKRGEGPSSLGITAMFFKEFAYVFRISVSVRKVSNKHPFCVLMYVNFCTLQIYFM